MTPLIVIRPEPGCAATVAAGQALGLEALGFPLFTISPRRWDAPSASQFDALLIGSANALRHAGAALADYRALPAYAVGETTAQAVRAAGLTLAGCGQGGMQALLGMLDPAHRRLLRLGGEERISLVPPPDTSITDRVVYASTPAPFPPEMAELLRSGAVIALHSGEAARHLAAQCVAHGIHRARLRLVALSGRIGAAAGQGWGEIAIAANPDDKALLALARQMCQEPAPGDRSAN